MPADDQRRAGKLYAEAGYGQLPEGTIQTWRVSVKIGG